MIIIAGITLPESAVWVNEIKSGARISNRETCPDGIELIFTDKTSPEIDIYIPKISGEITRAEVLNLKALSENVNEISININGTEKTAVFRHSDTALELYPITPKQTQDSKDSYYGYIRLLEV